MNTTAIWALAAITASVPATRDSWGPFTPKRVVAPDGKTYVVVRETKKNFHLRFELCTRRPGVAPIKPAEGRFLHHGAKPDPSRRDPKDKLTAEGKIDQLPLDVRVLNGGRGFVLFEKHGGVGYGKTLIYVNGKGEVAWSKTLEQLFGAVPAKSKFSVSSIWWNRGWWIDHRAHTVFLSTVGDELREVSLTDGSAEAPAFGRLLATCESGVPDAKRQALELISRREADERKLATPIAMSLARDERQDLGVRLRAAVVLARAKSRVDHTKMMLAACASHQPEAIRRYAARHLVDLLGTDAIPYLRKMMRGKATAVWHDCQKAFVALGDQAVPTLLEMLADGKESPDHRGGAAHALAEIGSTKSLDGLFTAIATADEYTANAACNAAIAIGHPKLAERLAALLAKGSTQDGRIALFFQDAPNALAIPALEAAVKRHDGNSDRYTAKWIRQALDSCRKGLEKTKKH